MLYQENKTVQQIAKDVKSLTGLNMQLVDVNMSHLIVNLRDNDGNVVKTNAMLHVNDSKIYINKLEHDVEWCYGISPQYGLWLAWLAGGLSLDSEEGVESDPYDAEYVNLLRDTFIRSFIGVKVHPTKNRLTLEGVWDICHLDCDHKVALRSDGLREYPHELHDQLMELIYKSQQLMDWSEDQESA